MARAGRQRAAVPSLAAAGATPVASLQGVGPRMAEKLAARGLLELQDLWLLLPRQYEDRTRLSAIRSLQPGVPAQVEGTVAAVERGFRYRPSLRVAIVDDSRATLVLRFFHFRGAQAAQFAPGTRIRCYGSVRPGQHGLEMVHPSYRLFPVDGDAGAAVAGGAEALDDQLSPVYPAVEGVGPATVRRLVGLALDRLPGDADLELLPEDALAGSGMPSLRSALLAVHRPARDADIAALLEGRAPAQRRLALEEMLAHHLSLRRQRIALQRHAAPALAGAAPLVDRLRASLPFALTGAQARVFEQVRVDLARPVPMLRLVQGDVGSEMLWYKSVLGRLGPRKWAHQRKSGPEAGCDLLLLTLGVSRGTLAPIRPIDPHRAHRLAIRGFGMSDKVKGSGICMPVLGGVDHERFGCHPPARRRQDPESCRARWNATRSRSNRS